jgi:hypothetical protein
VVRHNSPSTFDRHARIVWLNSGVSAWAMEQYQAPVGYVESSEAASTIQLGPVWTMVGYASIRKASTLQAHSRM